MSKKRKNTLFILISVSVLLSALILLTVSPDSKLHFVYKYVSAPFQKLAAAVSGVGRNITDKISYLNEYDSVKAKITELEAQNSERIQALEENERLVKENEELRKLLGLKEYYSDYDLVAGNVIAGDITDWYNELIVDVGTSNGVKDGDPVITADGLVGVVRQAGLYSSKIMTIADEQNVIMGRISRNGELVRVRGMSTENYSYELKLDRIAITADLYVGDVIVTAESGGILPKGIKIGVVSSISTQSGTQTRTATVASNVNINTLSQVFILTTAEDPPENDTQ